MENLRKDKRAIITKSENEVANLANTRSSGISVTYVVVGKWTLFYGGQGGQKKRSVSHEV